jgi:hypothetical protein
MGNGGLNGTDWRQKLKEQAEETNISLGCRLFHKSEVDSRVSKFQDSHNCHETFQGRAFCDPAIPHNQCTQNLSLTDLLDHLRS